MLMPQNICIELTALFRKVPDEIRVREVLKSPIYGTNISLESAVRVIPPVVRVYRVRRGLGKQKYLIRYD